MYNLLKTVRNKRVFIFNSENGKAISEFWGARPDSLPRSLGHSFYVELQVKRQTHCKRISTNCNTSQREDNQLYD